MKWSSICFAKRHIFSNSRASKTLYLKDASAFLFSWTLFISQALLIFRPDEMFYSISSFVRMCSLEELFLEKINKVLLSSQSFAIFIERVFTKPDNRILYFDIKMQKDNSNYLNFDLKLNQVQLNFSPLQLLNGLGAIKRCWINKVVGHVQTSSTFGDDYSKWSYKNKFGDFYLRHLNIKKLDIKVGSTENFSLDHFMGMISLGKLRKTFLLFDLMNAECVLLYSKFNLIEIETISHRERNINFFGLDLIYKNRFIFDSRLSSLFLKTKICDNFVRVEYNMDFGAISNNYVPFFIPISRELRQAIYSIDILMNKIKGKWTIYETDIHTLIGKSILSKVTRLVAANIAKYDYVPILNLFTRDQNTKLYTNVNVL